MRGAVRTLVVATTAACTLGACTAHSAPTAAPGGATPSRPSASAGGTGGPAVRGTSRDPRAVTARLVHWRLPDPVSRAVAVRYAGGVLLAGGLGPGDVSTPRVLQVDPRTGSVHRLSDLAQPAHDSAGAVLAGRPTLFGGGGATELDVVQRLDPQGRWRVVGHLPQARSDLSVGTPAPRRAVVVGGYDGRRTPATVLLTRDGSHFSPVARLPAGIRYAGIGFSGGYLWVLGGERNGVELADVLRVDLRTGRVRRAGHLPRPLGHEAVESVGDRLLLLGGRTSGGAVTARMWWYEPARGTWSRAGRLPHPVADAASVSMDGSLYLLGGETPAVTAGVIRVAPAPVTAPRRAPPPRCGTPRASARCARVRPRG